MIQKTAIIILFSIFDNILLKTGYLEYLVFLQKICYYMIDKFYNKKG